MNDHALDFAVIIAYLVGVAIMGIALRGRQEGVGDYFLGSRRIAWPLILMSIVATETSTLTLIGVPALAYGTYAHPEQGGSLTYLQVVAGYLVARFIISWLFIPAYFQGDMLTAYQLLDRRFGAQAKHFAAKSATASTSMPCIISPKKSPWRFPPTSRWRSSWAAAIFGAEPPTARAASIA